MTFRVGQKVVCVEAGPSVFFGTPCNAVKGSIYTITKFWFCSIWHHPCVLVAECEPMGGYAFDANRFRPIVEPKTGVSFTAGAPKDSEKFDNRRKIGADA